MLFEQGFDTDPNISKLTGKPSGRIGRRTNWEIVESLSTTNRKELLELCKRIFNKSNL